MEYRGSAPQRKLVELRPNGRTKKWSVGGKQLPILSLNILTESPNALGHGYLSRLPLAESGIFGIGAAILSSKMGSRKRNLRAGLAPTPAVSETLVF